MKKNILLFIAAFALFDSYSANTQLKNNVVVTTEAGKVRGKIVKGISIFKNIPYAAAPVGDLRFAAPVKPKPWDGIRDAIKSGPTPPFYKPKDKDIDDEQSFG